MEEPTKKQYENWKILSKATWESYLNSKKSMVLTIIGIVIGIVVSIFVAQYYYNKQINESGEELERKLKAQSEYLINNLSIDDDINVIDFEKEFGCSKEVVRKLILSRNNNPRIFLKEAQLNLISGEYELARHNYDIYLDKNRDAHPIYLEKAFVLMQLRKFDSAIKIYITQNELYPNNVMILNSLGVALFHKQKIGDAINVLEKARKLQLKNPLIYDNLAVAYSYLHDYKDKAIEMFDKALELSNNSLSILSNKASRLSSFGDYEASINCYKKALEIAHNDPNLLSGISAPLIHLDRFEEAIEYCNKAIIANENYYRAYCNKGIALSNTNRLEEAEINFIKAIDINPKDDKTYFSWALMYYRNKDYDEALKYNLLSLEIKPKDEQYLRLKKVLEKHTENNV